jgi:dipeptidyl aminopeptidase/acylaminoacyl peptidase
VAEVLGRRKSVEPYSREPVIRGLTLWAPVSKPFPYNILYYTDEADDQGKWLRGEIAKFEADYDVFKYSIDRHLDWIQIPLVIHQGTADDAVPVTWSRELGERLKEQGKSYTYYEYPGADHNMRPNWSTVISRDVAWFGEFAAKP